MRSLGKKNKKLIKSLKAAEFNTTNIILKGIQNSLAQIDTKSLSKSSCNPDVVIHAYDCLIGHISDELIASTDGIQVLKTFWLYQNKLPADHHLHFVGLMLLVNMVSKSTLSHKIVYDLVNLDFHLFLDKTTSVETEGFLKELRHFKTADDARHSLFEMFYSKLKSEDVPSQDCCLTSYAFVVFLHAAIKCLSDSQGTMCFSLCIHVLEVIISRISIKIPVHLLYECNSMHLCV